MSVPWFGDTLSYGCPIYAGSPASEQFGPYVEKVGFYIPVESVENKVALEKLSGELAAKMGTQSYPFSPQETSRYDGCWLLALSVIKADSTDPRKVEAALPQVAAEYNGLNGNYALNEKGDKISYSIDIYKVYETEPGKYAHLKCGSYNSLTGVIFEDTKEPLP
jgi:ABC-type branched-subunit amino acid transport system substrate-binding protein